MSPRVQRIAAVGVVLVAVVATYLLLVAPVRRQAADAGDQLDEQRAALADSRGAFADVRAVKARSRAAYAELLRLGKALPEDEDLQSLLVQLSAQAAQRGVRFVALERETAASTTGSAAAPATVPLKLTVTGSFAELTAFVAGVQADVRTRGGLRIRGRLLRLDGVHVTSSKPGSRRLDGEIALTAFLAQPSPATQELG